ncbi:MAG: alpha/beta fold hydrolase [Erysipelotrichaceae bacterium]|jgi:dienelactone hydrolase|nr:alpha/beta fold hydrolase [Erysipelotrichaceae bacterium]
MKKTKLILLSLLALILVSCGSKTGSGSGTTDPVVKEIEIRDVEITTDRGSTTKATLVIPATDEPAGGYPLVILLHGFNGSRDEAGLFTDVANGLAEVGIASIRFDMPGCNESSEGFENYNMDTMLADTDTVLAYAKSVINVDDSKIGLLGYSMGGRVAAMFVTHTSIDSMVLWAPAASAGLSAITLFGSVEDMSAMLQDNAPGTLFPYEFYGSVIDVPYAFFETVRDSNPEADLLSFTGDVLVITGGVDSTVPKPITDAVIAAMVNAHTVGNLVVPASDHSFGGYGSNADIYAQVIGSTVDYFARTLK